MILIIMYIKELKTMKNLYLHLSLLLLTSISYTDAQESRDPFLWPFSDTSIWNMPIGSDAVYVDAKIEMASKAGMTVDEDILFLDPGAEMQEIYYSPAGWNRQINRCTPTDSVLMEFPVPAKFIVSPRTWDGLTPNSGVSALMPDGRTIVQTQPFAQCEEGVATSGYKFQEIDIYGEGAGGAHGGSGLSAIGGTLRLGELDEASDVIRHVLKVNLYGAKNFYYDHITKGYRWPAVKSDGYAKGTYYTKRSNPVVKACRMGALLALPMSLDIETLGLETTPAKILAHAFQNYGAYIVDDTAWDVWAIVCEWSPNGRVTDEFEKVWGFPMIDNSNDSPWSRDMAKIFLHLHVVDNNAPGHKGGGGKPLQPLAPPFKI